jgi:hypothetical protein
MLVAIDQEEKGTYRAVAESSPREGSVSWEIQVDPAATDSSLGIILLIVGSPSPKYARP